MRSKHHSTDPNRSPAPGVVIRWVDPLVPHIWQIGHEVEGEFRPWAGGSSEDGLRQLIGRELVQAPHAGIRDLRGEDAPAAG